MNRFNGNKYCSAKEISLLDLLSKHSDIIIELNKSCKHVQVILWVPLTRVPSRIEYV